MAALVTRLVLAGIRRRPATALLVTAVLAGAATVLAVALAVARVSDAPWMRTHAATDGAHVQAMRMGPEAEPARAARLPGVAAAAGPWEQAVTSLRFGGRELGASLVAGQHPGSAVAHPVVTAGRWLRPGEAVLEGSFASSIGARAGDRLVVGGRSLRVSGIAVSTNREPYPQSQPGIVHVAPADLRAIAPDPRDRGEMWALRLEQPDASAAFVARAQPELPGVHLSDWQRVRASAAEADEPQRIALFSFAVFLMLAAVGVVGVTVGARVIERERDLGVLRAVGATPRLVVGLICAEYAVLASAGAIAGLVAGQLLSPAFTARSAALLSATDTAGVGMLDALIVLGAVLVTAVGAALVPSARAASRPPDHGHARRGRPARLGSWLSLRGLPLPLAVGAGQATARRARAVLTVLALSVTVVTGVATLAMEATFDAQVASAGSGAAPLPMRPGSDLAPPVLESPAATVLDAQRRLRPVVYGLGGVLLVVSLLTLLATMLLSVRERAREHAVARALGFTPRQVVATVTASGAVLGTLAAVTGIPIGVGYFLLAMELAGSEDTVLPNAAWLALLLPAGVVLSAVAAVPAAVIATRARPATLLRDQ